MRFFKDELFRARAEMYLWIVLIIPTLLFWNDSILWIAFMSIYAIIKSQINDIDTIKAKREGR